MASTALVFGERLTTPQGIGALLVLVGLVLTIFGPALLRSLRDLMDRTL
jgi:drug/metabolite transporter (DMT)-like permease